MNINRAMGGQHGEKTRSPQAQKWKKFQPLTAMHLAQGESWDFRGPLAQTRRLWRTAPHPPDPLTRVARAAGSLLGLRDRGADRQRRRRGRGLGWHGRLDRIKDRGFV